MDGFLFSRTERFCDTQESVPQTWILAGQRGQLLSECRDAQRPVDQQEAAGIPVRRKAREQQPRHRQQTEDGLNAFDADRRSAGDQRRASPFGQETLVLAPNRPPGAMSTNGGQPEQGIEKESTERTRMTACAR